MIQVFPGGKQFTLQNNGHGTCAVSYQGGFVMMGGYPLHGKVDRWGENNNVLFPTYSCPSSSIPNLVSELVPHDVAIQSNHRGNAPTSGQITSNFLREAVKKSVFLGIIPK